MDEMEKYGVVTDLGDEKFASAKPVCPVCGRDVERHGGVLKCPVHGTRPFEREKKIEKDEKGW